MADPSKTSVAQLLGALSFPQLWGLATALVSLMVGCISFGAFFQPEIEALIKEPKTCAQMRGYPRGVWFTKGLTVNIGRKDETFDAELGEFRTPKSGIWWVGVGPQLPDGSYEHQDQKEFVANLPPKPGASITITFKNPQEQYFDVENLLVSDDGCSMRGDYDSTIGPDKRRLAGFVDYCWNQAPKCPPVPYGWRPAQVVFPQTEPPK